MQGSNGLLPEKDDKLNRHAKLFIDSLKCDLTGPLSAEEIVARKKKHKLAQELLGIQEAIDKCQDDSGSKISKMRRTRDKLRKKFRKVLGIVMRAELLSSNKEVVIRLSQLSLTFLGDVAVPRRS